MTVAQLLSKKVPVQAKCGLILFPKPFKLSPTGLVFFMYKSKNFSSGYTV